MEKPELLVVDQDPLERETHCRMLGRAGFRCDPSHSAEDALRCLEANRYDLVLTEAGLRDADGAELGLRIRMRRPHIPIFAIADEPGEVATPDLFAVVIPRPVDYSRLAGLILMRLASGRIL